MEYSSLYEMCLQGIIIVVFIIVDYTTTLTGPCRQECFIKEIGHHELSPSMVKFGTGNLGSSLWVLAYGVFVFRFSEKNPSSMDMTTMIKLVFPTYDIFSLSYNVLSPSFRLCVRGELSSTCLRS